MTLNPSLIFALLLVPACAGEADFALDGSAEDGGWQADLGFAEVSDSAARDATARDDAALPADGSPGSDTSGPGNKTCSELQSCINKCTAGDTACAQSCVGQSAAQAQAQYAQLNTCFNQQAKSTCAAQCAVAQSDACLYCIANACEQHYFACFGGGPATPGFGDDCGSAACVTGLKCLRFAETPTKGFCSKACDNPGHACAGAPPSTMSFCFNSSAPNTSSMCLFICEVAGLTAPCPPGLTCAAADPPGSGQRVCVN